MLVETIHIQAETKSIGYSRCGLAPAIYPDSIISLSQFERMPEELWNTGSTKFCKHCLSPLAPLNGIDL